MPVNARCSTGPAAIGSMSSCATGGSRGAARWHKAATGTGNEPAMATRGAAEKQTPRSVDRGLKAVLNRGWGPGEAHAPVRAMSHCKQAHDRG